MPSADSLKKACHQTCARLRRCVRLSRKPAHYVLIATLAAQLALPVNAFAGLDGSKSEHLTSRVDERQPANSELFAQSTDLEAAQRRRNQINGRSDADAFNDVYFTAPDSQWAEFATRAADGKVTSMRFESGRLNAEFSTPPRAFSFEDDVKVTVEGDLLIATLEQKVGKTTRIYRRVFRIPGIRSVVFNSAFAHILLESGEIRSVLGWHNRLFQFSELREGGNLFVAVTAVLTQPAFYGADSRLKAGVTLQNHDARSGNGIYAPGMPAEYIASLRYGDIEVVAEVGGEKKVVEAFPLASIAQAAHAHLGLLKVREQILSGEKPFLDFIDGAKRAAKLAQQNPGLLPKVSTAGELAQTVSDPSLSAPLRRTAQAWKDLPWETPVFASNQLDQLSQFIDALIKTPVSDRATYPGDPNKEPQEGTSEHAARADQENLVEQANQLAARSTHFKWAYDFFANHQNKVLVLSSLAAVQAIIYFMPNSPMFEAGSTNLLWVKTHNIDMAIPGLFHIQSEGWAVPYILKFWALSGAIYAATVFVLPVSFAYLSDRILGRPLPRGFKVKREITETSGWQVFTTFGLRLGSYLLVSWRDALARATATIVNLPQKIPMIGGLFRQVLSADGLPTTMQAMRYGQNPVAFLGHETKASAGWWKNLLSVWRRAYYAEGADPSEVQTAKETVDLVAYRFALYGILSALQKSGELKSEVPLDSVGLRRELGEEKFAIVQKRFELLALRAKSEIGKMGVPSEETDFTALLPKLAQTAGFDAILQKPLAPLTPQESDEVKAAASNAKLARFWPRVAGSNEVFFRFNNAEAHPNSVTTWSANFKNDISTHSFWMGATPGQDAFASNLNTPNLLFGDASTGLLGIGGMKGMVELAFNFGNWMATIPTDELTYGKKQAAQIPRDFQNRARVVDGHNPVYRAISSGNQSGLLRTSLAYATWMIPTHTDFWTGIEVWSDRVTKHQLRTWKNVMISGTMTTFLGMLLAWPGIVESMAKAGIQGDWKYLGLAAFFGAGVKTLAFNTVAYPGYRPFWFGHFVGVRNMQIEPDLNSRELTGLVMNAREALQTDNAQAIHSTTTKFQSFYQRFGKNLPKAVLDITDPRERLEAATVHATAFPPMITAGHPFINIAGNQVITGITTILGTLFGAWAWTQMFDTSWLVLGGEVAALYAGGHATGVVSRNMRAGLSYNFGVADLRAAVEKAEDPGAPGTLSKAYNYSGAILRRALGLAPKTPAQPKSPGMVQKTYNSTVATLRKAFGLAQKDPTLVNRQKVLKSIWSLVKIYHRYDRMDVLKDFPLDTITIDSDVVGIAKQMYLRAVKVPPVENTATWLSSLYESECAQALWTKATAPIAEPTPE